jgi:hypothetical protein
VIHGTAGRAVPQCRRLALIGDADRSQIARRDTRILQRALRRFELRAPDIVGIVLDPARLGKVLRKLALVDAADRAAMIENDRARTGRPLIERENVFQRRQRS